MVYLFQEVLSAIERCSTENTSSSESRNYLSNNSQHLLQLPYLAQLAQLGHLAHLGHLNFQVTPAPPEKKTSAHAPVRSRIRSVQCPVC